MTRHEWLARFDRESEHALTAALDSLVAQCIAAGGTPADLTELSALWRVEVEEQVPPLRARAVRALQAAPDAAIVWDCPGRLNKMADSQSMAVQLSSGTTAGTGTPVIYETPARGHQDAWRSCGERVSDRSLSW